MKTYGYLWKLAAAQVLATTPDCTGELYLGRDGELVVVEAAAQAPQGSNFVAVMRGEATDINHVAARLAHVAVQAG
jgi:hypothetical protein